MIKAPISLQDLRRSLYIKAKAEPAWRFWGLYVHVCKTETLYEAYQMARGNDGAPGIDGVTFEAIEESGVEGFLKQIQGELVTNTSSAGLPKRTGDVEEKASPRRSTFLGFTHISGKNRLGRFTVRRKTIRKRMRAKLQEVKQQLRERMHDPVRQTGHWLRSIMQGHFNYYAVPENLDSLGVFRDRLIGQWWRTLRRRSQKHPISWTRILALADRWLLNRECSILTPRFALSPVIRDKNRMR